MRLFQPTQLWPGRPPKLNLAHPAFAGGAGRLAAVSVGDGSARDLLSGAINNPAIHMAGEFTPGLGPTVHPTGAAPTTGCQFNAVVASEAFPQMGMAAIFSPRVINFGQTILNLSNTQNSSPHRINITGGTVSLQTFTFTSVSFPVTPGHLYFFAGVASGTAFQGVQGQGVLADLNTGQVLTQTSSTGHSPTSGPAYTYGIADTTGGGDQGRVATGAIWRKWLSMRELLDWATNDPWGLWYAPSSTPINILTVANNAPTPGVNNLSLSVNDAIETFAGRLTNVEPSSNNMVLAVNDAVEFFQGNLTNVSPSKMDTHDGDNYVPAYLADRWERAREKYNPKKPDEQTDTGPRYLTKPKKVKIRRLKAKKKVMVRRLKAPA